MKDPPYNGTLATRREGWRWLDGTPYEWTNWKDLQPTGANGYVWMNYDGKWADAEPTNKFRYLCELSMEYIMMYIFEYDLTRAKYGFNNVCTCFQDWELSLTQMIHPQYQRLVST